MKPTIKDVAKHANVSIATVSRILNHTSVGYSTKTENLVRQAVEELGYRPNAVARGLINNKTQTIGVLFPDVSGMLTSELLYGLEEVAHRCGHSVIFCNTSSSGEKTLDYLQLLSEKRVEGVIFGSSLLTETYYNAITAMNIPAVLVSTKSKKHPLPYVKVDDKDAAYTATAYLIKKGHRRIAMLSGNPDDSVAGKPRIDGYREALLDSGLKGEDSLVFAADGFSYEDGRSLFTQFYETATDVTAVFAASDEMAVGALSTAYQMNVRIPDQLSIIGYDNLKISEMAIPPLTTVEQPLRDMGKKAAELLFEGMETGTPGKSIIMPHRIIERQSVKQLV
ncbi:LacI family DNA-binding transcriptional regulator [Sediminibacillus dalangtanensis]|uniref:LacI family DNA-binding transcriptional regulator n=1 Tax=Sediminibacillus dalangtanensis TaxID=2729421 RepID=A0ABX7VUD1_9BACI|nr:substrate-binding domain-containing protein [Sediminibacillus dalangtanensis]QTN00568.1 LacI family DNA-binding transcriptional regulator [Sediminibacillus dalangtanensis]